MAFVRRAFFRGLLTGYPKIEENYGRNVQRRTKNLNIISMTKICVQNRKFYKVITFEPSEIDVSGIARNIAQLRYASLLVTGAATAYDTQKYSQQLKHC